MASFDINEVARRVQSTSTGQDGPYTFNFQVNAASEIQVFRNDTLQTESTHYNTTLNADGTGSITFIDTSGSGGTDHSPTSGDVITIIGDQPLSRTTVFATGSVNQPATLETEFDNVVIRQQQLKEMMDRSIQLKASTRRTVTGTGTSGPLQFPYDDPASNNASKVIAYDSDGTSLELGPTTANLTTLAGISSDISTVAGISSNVTSVAGNATNINTVAGISSNITTVAGISANVTTVAGISSNVTTVASANSNISTVASGISNVNTVAGSISNVNTTAGSISNVNTVAGSISNVNTVASNVTGVNSFAERYRVGSSDPSSDNDAGDLFFNTTGNTLKFFDGSSFNAITSGVADSEVTTAKIADSAVTTAKINADAITGAKIADDAINSEHYTDGSIDTAHIADNQITNAKMADDSVGSAELIDNSVGAAALNISGNGSSGQMIVSDADGSFSYADQPSGGFSYTSVSGTTPSLDVGANNFFDQGTTTGNTTLSFTNVPTQAQWKYSAKIGTSVGTLNTSTQVGSQFEAPPSSLTNIYGCHMRENGTQFFLFKYPANVSADGLIYEFALSSAYDFSSASLTRTFNYSASITNKYTWAFHFDPTGTHFHATGFAGTDTTHLYHFVASTPFNVSTLSKQSGDFDHSAQTNSYRGIAFKPDGLTMVLMSSTDAFQYTLSSAYVSSGASYASKTFNFNTVVGSSIGSCFGCAFNSDGSKFYVNSINDPAGGIYAFDLSSNYDISTASYSGENDTHNHTSTAARQQRYIQFADSFGRYFMNTTSGEVTQHSLAAPNTITLPSSVGQTPTFPADSTGSHTTLAANDRVTFEFFTADGGTNVNLVNVERQD